MTDISEKDKFKLLLTDLNLHCDEIIEAGDTEGIRTLSREIVLCLNRTNRALSDKEQGN